MVAITWCDRSAQWGSRPGAARGCGRRLMRRVERSLRVGAARVCGCARLRKWRVRRAPIARGKKRIPRSSAIVEIEQGMLLQGEAPLIYLMSDRVRRSRTLDALFFLSIFLRPDLDD